MWTVVFFSIVALSGGFLAAALINHMILSWKKHSWEKHLVEKSAAKGFDIPQLEQTKMPVVIDVKKIKKKNPSKVMYGDAYLVDINFDDGHVEPIIAYFINIYDGNTKSRKEFVVKRAVDFSDIRGSDYVYDLAWHAIEKHQFKESFEFDDALEVENGGSKPPYGSVPVGNDNLRSGGFISTKPSQTFGA